MASLWLQVFEATEFQQNVYSREKNLEGKNHFGKGPAFQPHSGMLKEECLFVFSELSVSDTFHKSGSSEIIFCSNGPFEVIKIFPLPADSQTVWEFLFISRT